MRARITPAIVVATLVIFISVIDAQTAARSTQRQFAAPSADSLVAVALKQAKAERKTLFVDFRASWCGPCTLLQKFLAAPETSPIINANFIVVPITVWERDDLAHLNNGGGEALMKKWGGGDSIPFYAYVDASGRKLAHGSGYPDGQFDISELVDTMAGAALRITPAGRDVLFEYLASATRLRTWATATPGMREASISDWTKSPIPRRESTCNSFRSTLP